jgi:hypothetical protein
MAHNPGNSRKASPAGKSRRSGKRLGFLARRRKVLMRQVKTVKATRENLHELVEVIAWWLGVVGFTGVIVTSLYWGFVSLMPQYSPLPMDSWGHSRLYAVLLACVLAASGLGWLLVNDGQRLIRKSTGRPIMVILFGVLPMICLVASLFPATVARTAGLPPLAGGDDQLLANANHPFWLFVRFYPPALIGASLLVAFKATAQPRKYFKRDRALKFLLLASPYVAVLVFQEINILRHEAVEGTLQSTLGGVGLNLHLILTVLAGGAID